MSAFKKLYYRLIVTAALLAIVTGFILPMDIILLSNVKIFTHFVSSFFPGVSAMSGRAINPARAELTWALQWIFFPIYLCLLFMKNPIYGKKVTESFNKSTRKSPITNKERFMLLVGVTLMVYGILADFGVGEGPGFFRGTIFEGNISKLPASLRAPFTSNVGMVLYAWFIPIATALYYWGFLLFVVNFRSYINLPISSESAEK